MGILSGPLTIPMNRRKKDPKTHKPIINKRETDKIYCPKCNSIVTYRVSQEQKTKVCPWCKHLFIPAQSVRSKQIPWDQWDSRTDWDEI